ncbi:hypothetical protein QWZ08_26270 [Ferruginibacter paludis]|uniref:hypothetical protein n=1 Tax=Ferruginibacter paludis TaxID=1310417 RepID=UPI0025B37A7E|nr:hypothetical protein [Ferruginibacter paludis]MDN3659178.1 hypothetical protein [Ferruginibacter paludis]
MITFDDFINTEGSTLHVVKTLQAGIERIKCNNIEEASFAFNVYKVCINKKKNEVIVTLDIFDVYNESLKMSIDDFYNRLGQIKN